MPSREAAAATETGLYAAFAVETGQTLAGRFRIERMLGMGAMGIVYRAQDLELGQPVAVKLLRPEIASQPAALARFRQEILLARQVTSPHVVRIHDLFRDGELTLLAMDYVDGEGLDKLIERSGPLAVDQVINLLREVAEGLSAAHARGIVHRDLKPANILIDAQGHALISDFGIALSVAGGGGVSSDGMVVGTPDYLSPEQARGSALDGRSDLYALGLVGYEALTGASPFVELDPDASLAMRLNGSPPDVRGLRSDTPAWLAQLLRRLLRPQRAHRLPDAKALLLALETRRVETGSRHRKALTLAAISAGLLLLTLTYYWLAAHPPAAPTPVAAAPALPPRWLLLPLLDANGEFASDPLAQALDEGLNVLLDGQPQVVVVGSERLHVALTQLRSARPDAKLLSELRAELGALRVLSVASTQSADGVQLRSAFLDEPGAPAPTTVQATDLSAAAKALAVAHGIAAADWDALHGSGDDAALTLYGEALQLRHEGQIAQALERLSRALAARPGLNLARLQQLELSLLIGDRTQASAELALLPESLPGAAGLQRAWLQSLVEGVAPTATHPLQLAVNREPADLDARLRLIVSLGEAGERARALPLLRELVRLDKGDPRSWYLLGKYSILSGEVRPAVDEYLVQALVLYKRSRNRFGEGEVANAMGVGYGRLGQTADAEQQYRQALALRVQVGNRRGEASTLRNLAQIALIRGELDLAQSQLEQAGKGFQALGDDTGVVAVDNELGLLSEERGDYHAAIENYRRALRGRERLHDDYGAAESMNNIGFAHFQLGDLDSAQVYWRQAGDAFVKLEDLSGQVRIEQNLGLLATARGLWDEAEKRLLNSIELAEQEQMVEELSVSVRNLAELRLLQGRLGDALKAIERASALFDEREDQRGRTDSTLLRVRVLLAGADFAGAKTQLHALDAAIAGASLEQQALYALLRAELSLDRQERDDQLDVAARAAARAGIESLRLHVAIARQPSDPLLAQAVERLGHASLTLDAALAAIEAQVQAHASAAAIARYEKVLPALAEIGAALPLYRLHQAGARAYRQAGKAGPAAKAQAAATAAFATLIAAAPAELAATLRAADGAPALPPP